MWSNSSFQLKLSENFTTNGVVLVKNEVFNSDFDIDNLMKTIPKTVEFFKGTYKSRFTNIVQVKQNNLLLLRAQNVQPNNFSE